MRNLIEENREIVKELFDSVEATGKDNRAMTFEEGMEKSIRMILQHSQKGGKLMLIGNGASAAISSHIATDFWRNVGVRAVAFNDASGLTCISNDFSYEQVFEKPIGMFADPFDLLIAISSSGHSENILKGVETARKKNLKVITLSGFKKDNPLRQSGDINFYVPSASYGHVEVVHHSICHSLIDVIIKSHEKENRSL